MKGAYLSGLYSELEEAYNKWFWYYSEPDKHLDGDKANDPLVKQCEKELMRLWSKYQAALKEEGKFPWSG